MRPRGVTIRLIVLLSLNIMPVALFVMVAFYASGGARLHRHFVTARFDKQSHAKAAERNRNLDAAGGCLARLKGHVSLLDTPGAKPNDIRQQVEGAMAENLQFPTRFYNCYFAFQPEYARKYFGRDAYVLSVHKNTDLIGKPGYNLPENGVSEVWTDPSYQTDDKEVWYHVAEQSRSIEMAIAESPDVIVLDLMMPEVTGFDVVPAGRDHPSAGEISVIVFSAMELTAAGQEQLSGIQQIVSESARDDLLGTLPNLSQSSAET